MPSPPVPKKYIACKPGTVGSSWPMRLVKAGCRRCVLGMSTHRKVLVGVDTVEHREARTAAVVAARAALHIVAVLIEIAALIPGRRRGRDRNVVIDPAIEQADGLRAGAGRVDHRV